MYAAVGGVVYEVEQDAFEDGAAEDFFVHKFFSIEGFQNPKLTHVLRVNIKDIKPCCRHATTTTDRKFVALFIVYRALQSE